MLVKSTDKMQQTIQSEDQKPLLDFSESCQVKYTRAETHTRLNRQVWSLEWDNNMVEEVAETEGAFPPAPLTAKPHARGTMKKKEGGGHTGGGAALALGDSAAGNMQGGTQQQSVGKGGGVAGQKRPAAAAGAGAGRAAAPVSKKVAKLKKGLGMK